MEKTNKFVNSNKNSFLCSSTRTKPTLGNTICTLHKNPDLSLADKMNEIPKILVTSNNKINTSKNNNNINLNINNSCYNNNRYNNINESNIFNNSSNINSKIRNYSKSKFNKPKEKNNIQLKYFNEKNSSFFYSSNINKNNLINPKINNINHNNIGNSINRTKNTMRYLNLSKHDKKNKNNKLKIHSTKEIKFFDENINNINIVSSSSKEKKTLGSSSDKNFLYNRKGNYNSKKLVNNINMNTKINIKNLEFFNKGKNNINKKNKNAKSCSQVKKHQFQPMFALDNKN